MNKRSKAVLLGTLAVSLMALLTPLQAQEQVARLLRQPDVSKTDITFTYGGDLWIVPRTGGIARRLTANPSIKRFPKFSPDGKSIAFSGNYDGNTDVYVIPAEGGEPARLTYHPAPDGVLGWTPDSQAVLFRSGRNSHSYRFGQVYTLSVKGGLPKQLPLPQAGLASLSPDGKQIAYNRIERENATWKRYRGGLQAYISVFDLTTNRYYELPHSTATDFYPMWRGDKIYFASDRTNTVNLFSYDLKTKATKQLTKYTDYDVKWPSAGQDAIVFEQGGQINLFDLATEKVTTVPIQIKSDMLATRPSLRRVEDRVETYAISPSGARAVFTARGEIFTVPARKGETRNISNSPGVRELNATWSPDGKYVAYLSDKSGEYELYYRAQDGTGEETRLTTDGSVYRYGPTWSPDSKALLYTDATMRLWMVTLANKQPVLIDKSEVGQISLGKWSADSKWIAYVKPQRNTLGAIALYSVEQKKSFQITTGRFDDKEPTFDQNGKFLYFVSDRTFNPSFIGPEIGFNFQNTSRVYAFTLQKETPSPFTPESDEEKVKEEPAKTAPAPAPAPVPSGMKIDLDGIEERIITLPSPPGNYNSLNAGTGKLFYVNEGTLNQFDLASKQVTPLLSGIQSYDINANGTKIIYHAGGVFGIIDAAPGQSVGAGRLTLSLETKVDPRAEWLQIFNEAWRLERDFYYDPNMRGLDWKAIGERYRKLVPSVAHRDDLSYLLGELIGELNTSHAYVQQGEIPPSPNINVGLLGVDYEDGGAFYRIKKIYRGQSWEAGRRSPLREPGVNVKEGDYLIAVNGKPASPNAEPYSYFENTLGKSVTLKVNDKPSAEGAREIVVRPIASEGELRYTDWVEKNRQRIEREFNGRVGYFHVPDTGAGGVVEFGKGFYSQIDKEALIIDERFNSGGFIPDFYVEKLVRKQMSIATPRYGMDFSSPTAAVFGPKAILADEWSGSGGDAFPYFFKKAGAGPIIGKRTWGGLVGINGGIPLLDGGSVTVPQFGLWSPQDGKWIAENHGIDPDIEVDYTPDKTLNGADPQLDRAIEYIREQLKKSPPKRPQHPPFPIEKLNK